MTEKKDKGVTPHMRVSAWLYLLQQLLSSACILWAIGRCAGCAHTPPWRLLLAGMPPALMSMAAVDLPLLRLVMTPACALSPLAAWPDAPRSLRRRMALAALVLPLLLTGLMRMALALTLPASLAAPLVCGALLLLAQADRPGIPLPRCTSVDVSLHRRSAVLTALVDSGNLLRDPLTGLPVIVISRRAAARLTPLPPEGELLPGMRLIRVRTVAGISLMPILRPDSLRIRIGGAWQQAEALIGLSPGGGEGFQALVPASLVTPGIPPAPIRTLSAA